MYETVSVSTMSAEQLVLAFFVLCGVGLLALGVAWRLAKRRNDDWPDIDGWGW